MADSTINRFGARKPKICFAGPMLGRHRGWVPNPCESLAPKLEERGYHCLLTSSYLNRYRRAADILTTIYRQRKVMDILCIQVYGGPSLIVEDLASWLGLRLGYRVQMVLHGGAMPEFIQRYPDWSRRVFQRAHQLIAPSGYLAQALQLFGFSVRIIPNAIDLPNYPYRHRPIIQPRLLWMRTFHEVYNPVLAVEAFAGLKQFYPDAIMTMAGQEKGFLEVVKSHVNSLNLDKTVKFYNFLDIHGKQQQFAAHDVFLNTNRIDNTPVSVIEAAAFGLPIVATRVGGVPFLLEDGRTALLVPGNDAAELVQAIRRLLDEPGLADRLSANGRQMAEQFDWFRVLDLWEKSFGEVLGRS